MLSRLLLAPEPVVETGKEPIVPAPAPAPAAADPTAGYAAALKKHGDDAASFARTTYADNDRLRTELATAHGKLPKEGSLVLSAEDAGHWTELLKLGKPAEIRAAIETGSAAAAKVAAFERTELIGQAAAPYGYNPKVLADLARDGLRIEIKAGTALTQMKPTAEVVTVAKDAKGVDVETRTPLDKYAQDKWSEYLPALKAGSKVPTPAGGPPGSQGAPRPEITPKDFRKSLVK